MHVCVCVCKRTNGAGAGCRAGPRDNPRDWGMGYGSGQASKPLTPWPEASVGPQLWEKGKQCISTKPSVCKGAAGLWGGRITNIRTTVSSRCSPALPSPALSCAEDRVCATALWVRTRRLFPNGVPGGSHGPTCAGPPPTRWGSACRIRTGKRTVSMTREQAGREGHPIQICNVRNGCVPKHTSCVAALRFCEELAGFFSFSFHAVPQQVRLLDGGERRFWSWEAQLLQTARWLYSRRDLSG